MTKTRLALVFCAVALSGCALSGCALKGSKEEARYEGTSNCVLPGFSCGKLRTRTNDGLTPTAQSSADNVLPSFSGGNNYAPLCRMKKDKCVCACEPVN